MWKIENRKILFLIIFLIALLLIVFIFRFITPLYFQYQRRAEQERYHEEHLRFFPEEENINIVCLENDEKVNCTDKDLFVCGEKIEIFATIERPGETFYVCMDMNYFGEPWMCSGESQSYFRFYEPEVEVPAINEKIPFIEIYLFPPNNYNALEDFIADIDSSKKIMSLYKNVICEK
ncbi:hypothetical protein KKA72_02360 [Patescibacteria group bacterium]|nr:hypothetical protein [Patescibacteria group bacterium]MBU1877162.1 hypothetical protein [Patescibacteria group bacterium]